MLLGEQRTIVYSCNFRSGQLTIYFFAFLKSASKSELVVQSTAFYLLYFGVVEKGLKKLFGR